MGKFPLIVLLASAASFLGAGGYMLLPKPTFSPTCDIKGNISLNTGEKIYHVKGQEFYEVTIIRTEYGERMFCSEEEARAAGWRRARN